MSFRPAFDTVGKIQSIRKCVSWRVCAYVCVSLASNQSATALPVQFRREFNDHSLFI